MNDDGWIRRHFPNLRRGRYKITSPYDEAYKCIAWAAGDTERWWWPVNSVYSFWPPNLPYEEAVEGFVRAFQTLGYQPCKDSKLEPKYEKLAIYTKPDGTPTHMARQLQS